MHILYPWLTNVPPNVPQNDLEKIIKSIKENPRITREELATIIGKSVKTVGRIIKDSKLISFVGSSKSDHCEIVEDWIMFYNTKRLKNRKPKPPIN